MTIKVWALSRMKKPEDESNGKCKTENEIFKIKTKAGCSGTGL